MSSSPNPTSPSNSPTTTTASPPSSSFPISALDLPPPASLPLRPLFLTLLLACPLLAALPPRKMDLFTLMLGGVWVMSAEEVGRGMRYGWRMRELRAEIGLGDGVMERREGGVGREEGGGMGRGDIVEERGVSDRIGKEVEGVFRERRGRVEK